ncbi:myosin light chain kinase 3-like, partial [Saccostrea echinata]|uniref:myosin light chain kinase 3-like n=1 Tax=Saccostrea echinata TaxID=191078 RepID=UPI002A82AB85
MISPQTSHVSSKHKLRIEEEINCSADELSKSYKPPLVQIRSVSVYGFYDILEELGRGAFGVVHQCVEKDSGRKYLAKFINTPYPVAKATVKNEIRIMSQLHHPKILQIKEAFEDHKEMILILE